MDMKKVERKWQERWEQERAHEFRPDSGKEKRYVLEMFSYPSGAKLHVGHWYNYGPTDSYARFKKMQGYEVFQPMGFDAFGLPAENFAIKTGIHPKDSTLKNIETMEQQLKAIGAMFDWSAEIKTCMPDYYKWTQWMFLKLYEKGLAYRKEAPVNWCPSCNTVLANEQVVDGKCERCDSTVVRRNLTQWFFKITDYAEELLSGLDKLDWPEKTKAMQRNWIGKSTGGEIEFTAENGTRFRTFTTRADTLFGLSYVVLAPEHPLVREFTTDEQRADVEAYIEAAAKSNEIERLSTSKEKTGVFTGSYAINPINGRKVPIWIGDYVLYTYGTGAVMGVPAHDERDFDFAKKYGLPITRVIRSADGSSDELPYTQYGVMCNSEEFDGLSSADGKLAVLKKLEEEGKGGLKTNYRLRDWLVSRQRYWGAPIPMVYCDHCGEVPVPEEQLPVELPYDVEFAPDGKSPLAKCESFVHTTCPKCGGPARRECDTLDTFVCSSWYYLRYADAHNDKEPFSKEKVDKLLPVDKYVGGAEHACMHLLYARFFTKALRDMGYLDFDEPFTSLVHQGVILGPDGNRMSKSRGNVISPDAYVSEYGSDVFRFYLMFGFSYTEGGPWNDDGIKAVTRFFDRVERAVDRAIACTGNRTGMDKAEKELNFVRHSTIKAVTEDMEHFSFNTAAARLMELTNAVYKYDAEADQNPAFFRQTVRDLVFLLAPFAPHFAEELNERMGDTVSVFAQKYPVCDESALVRDEVEIAVQINSKVKGRLNIPTGIGPKEAEALVLASPAVQKLLGGKEPKKVIVIPGRLVNLIVG